MAANEAASLAMNIAELPVAEFPAMNRAGIPLRLCGIMLCKSTHHSHCCNSTRRDPRLTSAYEISAQRISKSEPQPLVATSLIVTRNRFSPGLPELISTDCTMPVKRAKRPLSLLVTGGNRSATPARTARLIAARLAHVGVMRLLNQPFAGEFSPDDGEIEPFLALQAMSFDGELHSRIRFALGIVFALHTGNVIADRK
jgi:hypothetical protein